MKRVTIREIAAIAYQVCGAAYAPERVMDYFGEIQQGNHPGDTPLPVSPDDFHSPEVRRLAAANVALAHELGRDRVRLHKFHHKKEFSFLECPNKRCAEARALLYPERFGRGDASPNRSRTARGAK
jgi:hypothetical protein